ncbi:MAG: tRNA 2-thiouridine(34) synthase MnmA [Dissulfurispiraceae bacterium]|jgi:tRNA-specific 2-thiouridylase
MKKAVVGMSGGVDSSVTAYLLKNEGYDVEGVSFVLYEARLKSASSGCCSLESIDDARRTAGHIGIKHTVIDLREEFLEQVIEPFIDAYKKGVTPNPCILCNKYIKFPYLLKIADEKGAEYIATGHYAKVTHNAELKKGVDARKDQSYVLYVLRHEELSRLMLPLGEKTKQEVRETARILNMPAAARPESQEICFIGDKNYCTFMEGLAEKVEGPIIDIESHRTVGSHKGIHLYTIGQRKRLGIATPKPLYVADIDTAQNAIYIGPREAAMKRAFQVEEINWLASKIDMETRRHGDTGIKKESRDVSPRPRVPASFSFRAGVKVRSTMKDEPATITSVHSDLVEVVYDEPQWAPAPGQSAVFYDGDTVLGGGTIRSLHER